MTALAATYWSDVPRSNGIARPFARCKIVPEAIPTIETIIAVMARAVIPELCALRRSMSTATTPTTPRAMPHHCSGFNLSFSTQLPTNEVSTGCNPAMSALTPEGSPCDTAKKTPPKYRACIQIPTATVGAMCIRSSFGALVKIAMTHKAPAANINRMAKKVNGPASCVP